MILATHGIVGSQIVQIVYDADYQAVLDYATTQGYTLPSASQQLLQNQLVVDLKDGGIWSKLDTFAVFATDGSSGFALIDWIRLLQYTAVNSPTFTTNQGFMGNGTSSYIDTNFTPSTQGVNYTLDNASRMAWVSGTSTNTIIDGNGGQNNNFMNKSISTSNRFNSTNSMVGGNVDNTPDGYRLYNRTSSTNAELFVGTTQYSRTQSSASLPTQTQRILASSANRSSYEFAFYGMGASLVAENTDFNNALNTYLTSL
jgi:hypothetical protein